MARFPRRRRRSATAGSTTVSRTGFPLVGPPGDKLDDTERRHWLSSASVMHLATGLFVSGAWTQYEFNGTNAQRDLRPGSQPQPPRHQAVVGRCRHREELARHRRHHLLRRVWPRRRRHHRSTVPGHSGSGPPAWAGVRAAWSIDSEMTWWGVGAVQKIDAAAMDVYLAYRQYSADHQMGASAHAGAAAQIPAAWRTSGTSRPARAFNSDALVEPIAAIGVRPLAGLTPLRRRIRT